LDLGREFFPKIARRHGLEVVHQDAWLNGRWHAQQKMNMISFAIKLEHFDVPRRGEIMKD
jgi:hypothetical protein